MLTKAIEKMLDRLASGNIEYVFPEKTYTDHAKDKYMDRAYYPYQHHSYPEIICPLQGKLYTYVNSKWKQCSDGDVLVLLPGVVHTERYYRANTSYQLLWTIIGPKAVNFHITSYTPTRGYHIVGPRRAFSLKLHDDLWNAGKSSTLDKSLPEQNNFHAILMQALYLSLQNMDIQSTDQTSFQQQIAGQVKYHIDNHFTSDISVEDLARMFHYSPCHLNLLFRRQTGIPIHRYLLEKRLEKAELLLKTTNMEVKQAAYAVGFKDPLYFSRIFRRYRAIPPSKVSGD